MDDLYQAYANVVRDIDDLETKREGLALTILETLQSENMDSVTNEHGNFAIYTHKTYTYTDQVKNVEDMVKKMKAHEQEKGLAQVKMKTVFRYKK